MEDYYTHRNSGHRYAIVKIDDSGDIQMVDANGMADEQHTKIMRVYPHGFTSHSPKDAHMLALGLGGRRDLLVALGGEHHEKRIKNLKEGESVLYDSGGNVVFMKLGKGIACNAKKGPVEITSQDDKIKAIAKKDASFGSSGGITYIGGDGTDGTYDWVMTASGPSSHVKAKL